jgi:hypothetical protein
MKSANEISLALFKFLQYYNITMVKQLTNKLFFNIHN